MSKIKLDECLPSVYTVLQEADRLITQGACPNMCIDGLYDRPGLSGMSFDVDCEYCARKSRLRRLIADEFAEALESKCA